MRRFYLALAAGMFACMAISVTMSVSASNRAVRQNIEQERQQQKVIAEKEAAVREEARRITCVLVNSQVKVFRENAPITSTGRDLAKAWEDTARIFGCDKE